LLLKWRYSAAVAAKTPKPIDCAYKDDSLLTVTLRRKTRGAWECCVRHWLFNRISRSHGLGWRAGFGTKRNFSAQRLRRATPRLVRRRSVLACEGIIGFNLRRSFFQRRAGLATVVATTAAGHQRYAVADLDAAEAIALADATVPGLLAPFLADG